MRISDWRSDVCSSDLRMESQFPISLDIFVRGLRSGHPIPTALQLLTEEMDDPVGSEFGIVSDEIAFGLDLREALARMAERWGLPDIHQNGRASCRERV